MLTRSGHPYLLGESSKFHTAPMDPQQIVAVFVEINVKFDILQTFEEKLTKVERHAVKPHREIADVTTLTTHPISMLNI